MASFTSFNIIYGELNDTTLGYYITYTIDDPAPPVNNFIEVLLWNNQIDFIYNATSPIEISETVRPQFFFQGICVKFQLNYYDADTFTLLASSSEYYGVLQRRTDTGECMVMTTPVYFTQLKPANNQFKSVILPPSPPPGQKFSFKITGANGATFCAYMSNISYPLSTTQLTTTDDTFSGIFQNAFDKNYGYQTNIGSYPLQAGQTPDKVAIEFITNQASEWTVSRIYAPFTPTYGTGTPSNSKIDTSNARLLYYEWTDYSSNNIVLSGDAQNGFQKDVFIRNLTGSPDFFYVYGPQDYAIDDISGAGVHPYITYTIQPNSFATFSFIYQKTATYSNLYVTNFYNGYNITGYDSNSGPFPLIDYTISNQVPYTLVNANYSFIDAYQQPGTVRYYTAINAENVNYFMVSSDTTGNFFATGDATNGIRYISQGGFSFFNFATTYIDSVNSNVILPLGGFGI